MTQTYSAAYLRALLTDVQDFRAAFESWSEFRSVDFDTLEPTRAAKVDFSVETPASIDVVGNLRQRVAAAAGPAGIAGEVIGPDGILEGNNINLISRWRTIEGTSWTAEEVLDFADAVVGRVHALIQQADLTTPPALGPAELHALVWGAAKRLWHVEEYRRAVMAAADAVEMHGRHQTDRHDVDGVVFWQEAFSPHAPAEGKPRLRWPRDPTHKTVISMNNGLLAFSRGVQQTIRNQATHGQGACEYTAQEALERLAALSLLARWIDECELVEATEDLTQKTG